MKMVDLSIKYNGFWRRHVDRAIYVHPLNEKCYHCNKCIQNEPFYMVQFRLWNQTARMGPKYVPNDPIGGPFLHLACLEARIGRALTRKDFLQRPPVNDWVLRPSKMRPRNAFEYVCEESEE